MNYGEPMSQYYDSVLQNRICSTTVALLHTTKFYSGTTPLQRITTYYQVLHSVSKRCKVLLLTSKDSYVVQSISTYYKVSL